MLLFSYIHVNIYLLVLSFVFDSSHHVSCVMSYYGFYLEKKEIRVAGT